MSDTHEQTEGSREARENEVHAPDRTTGPTPSWWSSFGRRRLRTQLLLIVNLVVGTSLVAFLYADYLHSVRTAISTKAASLSDEARAIAVAIEPLRARGSREIQAHINAVCATMDQRESPGHLIETRIGDQVLKSDPVMHGEHAHVSSAGSDDRVEGMAQEGAITVRVSERTEGTVRSVQREAVLRAGIIAASAALGALIINVLLIRLVDVPVRRLTAYVRDVGRGEFGQPLDTGGSAEMSFLASEVRGMSRELARREDDRQRQLQKARTLQRHLMSAPGRPRDQHSAIAFYPADEVAGDFAEVMPVADGSVVLCLADVSGHGMAAAMGAAMIKALLLSHGASAPTPAALLSQINSRFLEASLPGDFASMIVVQIRPDRRGATFASAGHETCYLRRRGGTIEPAESTGLLLGVGLEAEYLDSQLELEPGDVFVLLSDGVSESMNESGDLFGRSRLVKVLEASVNVNPPDLAAHICQEVSRFRGGGRNSDDMTILVYAVDSQN